MARNREGHIVWSAATPAQHQPSPIALIEQGPRVAVTLMPIDIVSEGEPTVALMLVDTGAEHTLVSETICERLGTPPLREEPILSVSGKIDCPVYLMTITLPVGTKILHFTSEVIGMPSAHDHVDGLLGRDFLQHLEFRYDGPRGVFALMLPESG